MTQLNRKLLRDLGEMKGQALAIGLVIACGVATFVMSLSTLQSLKTTQATYYDRSRFAHVFAHLKRAPSTLRARIAELPGVGWVQTRTVVDVTIDVAGLAEPAVGRLISLPEHGRPALNDLHLRRGRYVASGRAGEALVSEAFAEAHAFDPGDAVRAVINGRRQTLGIVGIGLSPEYVLQMRAGELLPDDERFGIFWMQEDELNAAFNMEGAFNDVTLSLTHGAVEAEVIRGLDRLIEPYGGVGAYGRDEQISHRYLSDEIEQLRGMGIIVPIIFLAVAAFLLNVVLSRIVSTQREQIAVLKAFGYTRSEVAWHYLKLVLMITAAGLVPGCAMGAWLGRGMTELYSAFYRFPIYYFHADLTVMVWALGLSVGAAVAGTLGAVLRAVRLPPAEAMRPETPPTFRPTVVERVGLQRWMTQTPRMVLRQLERQPVKTLFSALGIAAAVAILVLGRFGLDGLDYLIEFEYHRSQRQDAMITFVEPRGAEALHAVAHLPGVRRAESFRAVPVRMRCGHRSRRLSVMGLDADTRLRRTLDHRGREIKPPAEGLVLSEKLAEVLAVAPGGTVMVEVQEGRRPTAAVRVSALITDYAGMNAYMDRRALHRLMHEGQRTSGAFVSVDVRQRDELYRTLKQTPAVAGVTIKQAAIESFMKTVAENQLRIQSFNVAFAVIIAFGVVYNTARISLSERSRELATLRVIGFTRAEISAILLGELAALTLMGLPLGLAMGYGLAGLVTAAVNTEMYRFPLVIAPATYGFAAAVTLTASVLSGLIVRRKLDRLDLVAVLKSKE